MAHVQGAHESGKELADGATRNLRSDADRFMAAVEGGEHDETVAQTKCESMAKSFEKQVPLGVASEKQRKRTDTNDRLDTKVVAALTGMQSILTAMGTNQASMAKRMRKMEKSSTDNWESENACRAL